MPLGSGSPQLGSSRQVVRRGSAPLRDPRPARDRLASRSCRPSINRGHAMPKDFTDGLYTSPPDTSIPISESGVWRAAVVTEPCRTSAELESRATRMEAEAAAGLHELPF